MWSQLASLASQVSETVAPVAQEFREALREDDHPGGTASRQEQHNMPPVVVASETNTQGRSGGGWLESVVSGVAELREALRESDNEDAPLDEAENVNVESVHDARKEETTAFLDAFEERVEPEVQGTALHDNLSQGKATSPGNSASLASEHIRERAGQAITENSSITASRPPAIRNTALLTPIKDIWGVVSTVKGAISEFQEALHEDSDEEGVIQRRGEIGSVTGLGFVGVENKLSRSELVRESPLSGKQFPTEAEWEAEVRARQGNGACWTEEVSVSLDLENPGEAGSASSVPVLHLGSIGGSTPSVRIAPAGVDAEALNGDSRTSYGDSVTSTEQQATFDQSCEETPQVVAKTVDKHANDSTPAMTFAMPNEGSAPHAQIKSGGKRRPGKRLPSPQATAADPTSETKAIVAVEPQRDAKNASHLPADEALPATINDVTTPKDATVFREHLLICEPIAAKATELQPQGEDSLHVSLLMQPAESQSTTMITPLPEENSGREARPVLTSTTENVISASAPTSSYNKASSQSTTNQGAAVARRKGGRGAKAKGTISGQPVVSAVPANSSLINQISDTCAVSGSIPALTAVAEISTVAEEALEQTGHEQGMKPTATPPSTKDAGKRRGGRHRFAHREKPTPSAEIEAQTSVGLLSSSSEATAPLQMKETVEKGVGEETVPSATESNANSARQQISIQAGYESSPQLDNIAQTVMKQREAATTPVSNYQSVPFELRETAVVKVASLPSPRGPSEATENTANEAESSIRTSVEPSVPLSESEVSISPSKRETDTQIDGPQITDVGGRGEDMAQQVETVRRLQEEIWRLQSDLQAARESAASDLERSQNEQLRLRQEYTCAEGRWQEEHRSAIRQLEHEKAELKELLTSASSDQNEREERYRNMIEKEQIARKEAETRVRELSQAHDKRLNEYRTQTEAALEQAKAELLKERRALQMEKEEHRTNLEQISQSLGKQKETTRAVVEKAYETEQSLRQELNGMKETMELEVKRLQDSYEKYVNDLRAEVAAKESEIISARAQLASLPALQEDLNLALKENADLKSLVDRQADRAELELALEEVAILRGEAARATSVQMQRVQALQTELEATRSDATLLKSDNAMLMDELDKVKKALMRTTQELERAESAHRQKVVSLRAELVRTKDEYEQQLNTANEKQDDLKQELMRTREELAQAQATIALATQERVPANVPGASVPSVSDATTASPVDDLRIVSQLVLAFVKRGRDSGDHGRKEVIETMSRMLGWSEAQRNEVLESFQGAGPSLSAAAATGVVSRGIDLLLSTAAPKPAVLAPESSAVNTNGFASTQQAGKRRTAATLTTDAAARLLEKESFEDVFFNEFLAKEAVAETKKRISNEVQPATPLSSRLLRQQQSPLSSPSSAARVLPIPLPMEEEKPSGYFIGDPQKQEEAAVATTMAQSDANFGV